MTLANDVLVEIGGSNFSAIRNSHLNYVLTPPRSPWSLTMFELLSNNDHKRRSLPEGSACCVTDFCPLRTLLEKIQQ